MIDDDAIVLLDDHAVTRSRLLNHRTLTVVLGALGAARF